MSIQGSVVNYFATAGAYEITLPRKGLTVVGISVSNGVLSVPISSGRTAYFLGESAGTYIFQPVQFVSDSGLINVTTTVPNALVIIYYGVPYPNTPSLSAYAGVSSVFSLSVPASASSALVSATNTVNFPANATKLTGFEYATGDNVTDISYPTELQYLSFAVSTGETMSLAVPVPVINAGFIPDFGTLSGILPLSVPISTSLPITLSGYFNNSSTSALTVSVSVVMYYA